MKTRLLAAWCCLLAGSYALADDWPQFRGPDRSGVSKEKGLLKAWPKDGPKLLWKYDKAGLGFSSMAIANGVVYTLGTDAKFKEEYVIAIDEKKGTELWRLPFAPLYTYKGNAYGDGPRSTPTIDGNLLFALSGDGTLVCIDIKGRKELWKKQLVKDLGASSWTSTASVNRLWLTASSSSAAREAPKAPSSPSTRPTATFCGAPRT
jgi:outer membrane protein assembly factor BamB